MKRIKLIWDFFGDDALPTAQHHAKHLEEFAKKHSLLNTENGVDQQADFSSAYLIVEESHMIMVRDALRPKRGEWVEN